MAPLRQPRSLHQLCVQFKARDIQTICEQTPQNVDFSPLVSEICLLRRILPAPVQVAIGHEILSVSERFQQPLSPTQVWVLLQLHVRRIIITGSVVQSGVLDFADGVHLQSLSLFYGGSGDRPSRLYSFLHTTFSLTRLQCVDFCNNKMLEVIASTCHNLQSLELRCCNVTDEGILKLCGLQLTLRDCIDVLNKFGAQELSPSPCVSTLREIKLSMTKVTEAGVAIIFLIMNTIELLRVPDIRMEQVFNFLQAFDNKNVQCNLKEFHSREILDEFQLGVLARLCPDLEHIQVSLIGNAEMDISRLAQLSKLHKLRSAKLADTNSDALIWFLQQVGHRMTNLHLYTYHTRFSQEKLGINRYHLRRLAECCQDLKSLCLDGYCLDEDALSPIQSSQREIKYFEHLRTLQLFSLRLSEEDLRMFLSKCKEMHTLEIALQNPHVFHDKLVGQLLDCGVWNKLAKMRVLNSPITVSVMKRIIYECPYLQQIGSIYTWLVPKQQVSEFKEIVRKENISLEIY